MENHNFKKIFEKSNIRIFKNKKYFTRFKNLLLTISPLPDKPILTKLKIYNNLKLKYSIIKKNNSPLNYWNIFYGSFIKGKKDSSIIKEKYLQFYSRYIQKKLTQLESQYSIELNILKQEYITYCQKKINPKFKKSLKITEPELSPKNNILSNEDIEKNKAINKTRNNITENNITKNIFRSLNPRNSIVKELYNLTNKSSRGVVDEYIGNINVDNIIKRKVDIQVSYVKKFGQKPKQKDNYIFTNKFKFKTPSRRTNYLNFNNYNKFLKKPQKLHINKNIISNYKSKEDISKTIYNNTDESKTCNSLNNKKSNTINNSRRYGYKMNIKNKKKTFCNTISPIKKCTINKKFIQRVWLALPLLKGKNKLLIYDDKKDKYCQNNIINKKYYINCNDLFY